jgi:hypothetical protein
MARHSRSSSGTNKVLRICSVRVFLSDSEHEALRGRAGKTALSRYLRERGLGECPKKDRKNEDINPLIQQFARVGNNLNQIARVFNVARVEGKAIYIVRFLAGLTSIEREMSDVVQNFCKRRGKGERD